MAADPAAEKRQVRKGWRVYQQGEAWVGQYRDKGRYKTKSFSKGTPAAQQAAATKWASTMANAVAMGVKMAAAAPTPTGPKLKTTDVARDYVQALDERSRSLSHLLYLKTIFASLAKAVPYLDAPDAGGAIATWLQSAQRSEQKGGGKLAPATRNKYLVCVRGMCRWAMLRDLLPKDPTRAIGLSSLPSQIKPQFTLDELRLIVTNTHYKTWRGMRKGDAPKADPWHRFAAVLLYTGMRYQEAAFLRWQDIDWTGNVVQVVLASGAAIKRGRERLVPLQPELRAILEPVKQTSGRIFPTRHNNGPRSFHAFLRRAGVVASGQTPHSFRHTYAGLMTATGVPSLLLGSYLGHVNASTTAGYTKLAARYAQAVTDWPRGGFRLLPPTP